MYRRTLALSVLGLLCLFLVSAAQAPIDPLQDVILPPRAKKAAPPASEKGEPKAFPTPNDGVRAARNHAFANVPFSFLTRYIWIPSQNEEFTKAVALTVNYISRSRHLVQPPYIDVPGGRLIAVYLPDIAPREQDLIDVVKTWEEFQFDPQFSLLFTHDVLELGHFDLGKFPQVKRRSARKEKRPGPDGKEVDQLVPFDELVSVREANVDVVRLDAPDIDPQTFAELKDLTLSEAPIVDFRYFTFRALSTIKDDGPYKVIFGGLYYDLRGIKKAKDVKGKEKATDLDVLLESLGIGNVTAGENFERFLDRVAGDLRPVTFISDVTGNPRAIVLVHSSAEREGGSWGGFTLDLKRKSIDVKQHPALSQIAPKFDAIELIFTANNGMPIFALFDGKGNLLEKADSDVVADRTVPNPHSTDLQSAISCIRCHGPEETWKPLTDALAVLLEQDRVRVLADVTNVNDLVVDTQDRILGFHSVIPGRAPGVRTRQQRILDTLLERQRQDFMTVVHDTTGDWDFLKGRQTEIAKAATAKISQIYGEYWYDPVSARQALLDIGLDVPAGSAAEVLTKLTPATGGDPILGVIYEDVRLQQLAAGGRIGRADFALIRSFVAGRVTTELRRLLEQQKKVMAPANRRRAA